MIITRARSGAGKGLLLLGFVALLVTGVSSPVHGQTGSGFFGSSPNGIVRVIVVQPNGKILIAGDFTSLYSNGAQVTRNRVARLNPDGSVDPDFNPNADGVVSTIALQADGKILVGGSFGTVGGTTRNRIARLDATTGLADSFNPNANGSVLSIKVQADGRILAGGQFSGANSIGGQTRNYLARLDGTSGLADSFNPNANAVVRTLLVQADGKILAGGDFTSVGGQTRNRVARLAPDTGLADSFNPNIDEENTGVFSLAVQADGKVLVGGVFSSVSGQLRNNIARLDPSTGAPDSFAPNPNGVVHSLAVQPDGKILAGGLFNFVGGQTRTCLARLSPTTGLADSFEANPDKVVYSIAMQADGRVLIGGNFGQFYFPPDYNAFFPFLVRLEADGRPQTPAGAGVDTGNSVLTTAVQPDGKILLGGSFTRVGTARNNIARLVAWGGLDASFNPNADGPVYAIAFQADGTILVGGGFSNIGGQPRRGIARLDGATGAVIGFNPNLNGDVYAIAVQADGKILVGGSFTTISGAARNRIARLESYGTPDSFNPNADSLVYTLAIQGDGKILVGGTFTNIGGKAHNRIARLDPASGQADDSFNPNATDRVVAIALQPDGKILVGGDEFTDIDGQARTGMARLDPVSGRFDSFNANANGPVHSFALQADGQILTAGRFSSIGGKARDHIARLDPASGQADQSFNAFANNQVNSIAVQGDGRILVGGFFTSIAGVPYNLFARLTNNTIARQELSVSQTAAAWMLDGSNPQFTRVTFEDSTNGVNYNFLGHGTATGSNWTLTGLNLSTQQNLYIRARGYYSTGFSNASQSIQESVRNVFLTPTPTTLANISTRLRVQGGENVLIGGMIVTGTSAKKVIVRARGPALSDFGVPGALADPTLEVVQGNTAVASNDDWRNSPQQAEIENSGFAPGKDAESAIIATLMPNQNYTAIVRGKNGEAGVGLMEIFDLDHSPYSKLANISTRGFVEVDDNVMIAGLIVGPSGGTNTNVLVRALGPTLGDFGVQGFLANPEVELVNSSGTVIRSNNDWKSSQRAEIEAAQLAPTHDTEAALLQTLAPGAYTAVVRGNGRTTGVGLVEVYNIP